MTFEDYLRDIHAKDYSGLDDDMAENFESWLEDLDNQEVIDYAEQLTSMQEQHIIGLKGFVEDYKRLLEIADKGWSDALRGWKWTIIFLFALSTLQLTLIFI